MIKLLTVAVAVFFVSNAAFSQTTKAFISNDGRLTNDATNAQALVTIEKISDTAYLVHQYDMNNVLLVEGTFKDAQLSNPDGTFTYYKIAPPSTQISFNYNGQKVDTIQTPSRSYKSMSGNYINGLKYGVWTEYYSDGSWQYIDTYVADKKNGLYEVSYNKNNKPSIVGNYADNKRNGDWYELSGKGDTISMTVYKDNQGIKTISYGSGKKFQSHAKVGYFDFDLTAMLRRKLSKSYDGYYTGTLIYTFTLTSAGKLTNPIVKNVSDLKLDKAVIEAILSCPDWKPTLLDNKPVNSQIEIDINFNKVKDEPFQLSIVPLIGYSIPGYDGY